jgi:hypothetical protein
MIPLEKYELYFVVGDKRKTPRCGRSVQEWKWPSVDCVWCASYEAPYYRSSILAVMFISLCAEGMLNLL